jgi:hypothetical protein
VATEHLFGPEQDGLAAYVVTAAAGADITIAAVAQSRGQYVCVIDGSLLIDGATYGPRSLGWHPGDDEPVRGRSGPDGCRVVVMSFPTVASQRERWPISSA